MADYNNRRKSADINRPWKHLTIKTHFSSHVRNKEIKANVFRSHLTLIVLMWRIG